MYSFRDESTALAYKFTLSSDEGALLILPKGADRYELLNEGLFFEHAARHGVEWYNYAVNRRQRIISHDSLYLITGFYKASSWSVAAFENTTGSHNERYTARFKRIEGNGLESPTYSWETTCALDWRVGPRVDYGIPNQAVFIRGFKIALRTRLLGTRRISVKADVPSTRLSPVKSSTVVPSNLRPFDRFPRLSERERGNNVVQTTTRDLGTTESAEKLQNEAPSLEEYGDMYVEMKQMPDVPPAFHPSDAINRYLLSRDPLARIAITSDSHWMSILEDGSLTPKEFEQGWRLSRVLSQNYRTVSQKGVVCLEKLMVKKLGKIEAERAAEANRMNAIRKREEERYIYLGSWD